MSYSLVCTPLPKDCSCKSQQSRGIAQIRPGGLAAFPVEVPGAGGAVEEALAIIVEVPRGARPANEDTQALASHVRATVRGPEPALLCQPHVCGVGAQHSLRGD